MNHDDRHEAFLNEQERLAREAIGDDPHFESYFEPYGEYGAPAYQGLPNDHKAVHRIASRRADFLESNYDVEENHAMAIAAAEMGLPARWVAEKLGVSKATVAKYNEEIEERFGHVTYATDPFFEVERPLEVLE